jgi:hypothetical protein
MESNSAVQAALDRHAKIYGGLTQKPETWDSMIDAMEGRNPWEPAGYGAFYDSAVPFDRKRRQSPDGNKTEVFGPHGIALGMLCIREVYGELPDGTMGLQSVVTIEV